MDSVNLAIRLFSGGSGINVNNLILYNFDNRAEGFLLSLCIKQTLDELVELLSSNDSVLKDVVFTRGELLQVSRIDALTMIHYCKHLDEIISASRSSLNVWVVQLMHDEFIQFDEVCRSILRNLRDSRYSSLLSFRHDVVRCHKIASNIPLPARLTPRYSCNSSPHARYTPRWRHNSYPDDKSDDALKDLGSKAEEMIEKTKTSVGEMAAEKKAAASALIEAQAKKTGDVLWQSKSNLESTAVDAVTETKQAAIDGFDKEIEKVEKTVEEGIQEKKEETKPVESTTPSEPSSMLDPSKLLGSLDISSGIGTVEKEVEKQIDSALQQVNTVVDTKMKEADELIDQKREEVVKTVQEEATKATSSTAEGFGAVLGKAKGFLNF